MRLVRISGRSDVTIAELSARVHCHPRAESYVIELHEQQVAYACLEKFHDGLWLYELFVAASFRGRGIGTEALHLIEEHVRSRGEQSLRLHARSLDDDRTDAQLRKWYRGRGYRLRVGNNAKYGLIKDLL